MTNEKIIEEIRENIFQTISNLTDARELLSQTPMTKELYEKQEILEEEIYKTDDIEEANRRFDIKIPYEQAIGLSAFLTGFKLSYDLMKAFDNKDFVEKALTKLYE